MSLDNHKDFLARSAEQDAISQVEIHAALISLIQRVPVEQRTQAESVLLEKSSRAKSKAQRIKEAKNQAVLSAILEEK